jgi:3-hydroxy acid dehydrogenase/malonic semialdehyde reductase
MSQKKILVTGASSGIGRAISLMMAQKGHSVLMASRRTDRLKEIASSTPTVVGELLFAELDVTSSASVEKFLNEHSDWLKGVDVLVNNAGLALGREPFQNCEIADVEKMIETNILGLLRVTRKILPFMLENKKGHIVNLGSVAGKEAYPSGTVYCATKAAVHMITDCLRIDLGGSGVRVSTVAPGRVAETEFSLIRFKGDEKRAQANYEGYRVMTAEEIASIVAWIVEQPEHINIQQVLVLPADQPTASTLAPKK